MRGARTQINFGFGGGPPPKDLLILLAVVLGTFCLRFFSATAWIPKALELSPAVLKGQVWRLITYPFIGSGNAGFFFLIELFFLFIFARTVYNQLGRRWFWKHLLLTSFAGSVVATVVFILAAVAGFASPYPFALMAGQHALSALIICTFAALNREAQILLFFVLPVPASLFTWLIVLSGLMGFLNSKDIGGFAGLLTVVWASHAGVHPGGPMRWLRSRRLEIERFFAKKRIEKLRAERGLEVLPPPPDKDDWVH